MSRTRLTFFLYPRFTAALASIPAAAGNLRLSQRFISDPDTAMACCSEDPS